jgi:hypothetical protein
MNNIAVTPRPDKATTLLFDRTFPVTLFGIHTDLPHDEAQAVERSMEDSGYPFNQTNNKLSEIFMETFPRETGRTNELGNFLPRNSLESDNQIDDIALGNIDTTIKLSPSFNGR